MTKKDIQHWADNAYSYMISEYTVAWIASESKYGEELALKWINSKKENIAIAGWSTLSSMVSTKSDHELDIPLLDKLTDRVEKEIHSAPNRVRYTMNSFLIAIGCYHFLIRKGKSHFKKNWKGNGEYW